MTSTKGDLDTFAGREARGTIANIEAFLELASDLQSIWGWTRTVVAAVLRGPAGVALAIGIFLVALLVGSAALQFLGPLLAWLAGLVALLAGLLAQASPVINAASSVLSSTASFADKLTEIRQANTADLLAAEVAVREAESEVQEKRAELDRSIVGLSRYVDPQSRSSPPRLYRYLVSDAPESVAMAGEVGVISRARQLFRSLNEITREERERVESGYPPDPDVPERIVLYIDDLDRCTKDQVYSVLQAVHLLLSFNLFAVVVGVDLGWVAGAVAKNLEVSTAPGDKPVGRAEAERKQRREALGYMEKIFQVAYWLPRLTVGGRDGTPDTYSAYVRELLRAPFPGHAPPEAGDEDAAPAVNQMVKIQAISLTEEEEQFLRSPQIGRVAGKSPRAVKRLVNICRLVKGRLTDVERQHFTGREGPLYPAAFAVAAVEAGQSTEVIEALNTMLGTSADDGELPFRDSPGLDQHPNIKALLLAVDERRGRTTTRAEYRRVVAWVARFSFNRYDPDVIGA